MIFKMGQIGPGSENRPRKIGPSELGNITQPKDPLHYIKNHSKFR
jgi:hypothetical protein